MLLSEILGSVLLCGKVEFATLGKDSGRMKLYTMKEACKNFELYKKSRLRPHSGEHCGDGVDSAGI